MIHPTRADDETLEAISRMIVKWWEPGNVVPWLFTATKLLGNVTPASLILEGRANEVKQLLDQIDS